MDRILRPHRPYAGKQAEIASFLAADQGHTAVYMPQLHEHPDSPLDAVLAEVVYGLHKELARLRSAIDQLRDELQFVVGVRDQQSQRASVLRITSLPKDPAAADFFNRINAVPPEQIEAMREEVARAARHRPDHESS